MASVFRTFDIHTPRRGDIGNIDISLVVEGVLCVIVFGLNEGYNFVHMRVKYPIQMCLYDVCKLILDTITKDFKTVTCAGYNEYMHIDKYEYTVNFEEDPELLGILYPNSKIPKFDFTRENVSYMKKYRLDYEFDIGPIPPNNDAVGLASEKRDIEGEVTPDGKFNYDFNTLYHYDDDIIWMG
jgi:hypothetical protein